MADIPPYVPELAIALAQANHDYFKRRGQTQYEWDQLPPIYTHSAIEAQLEILLNGNMGPIIEREVNNGYLAASTLRMRLDLFIADLKARPGVSAPALAEDLENIINEPMEPLT